MKKQNFPFQEQTHFIGILVSDELTSVLQSCRDYMNVNYNCKSGFRTPIHITLVPPFALDERFSTKQLVRSVQEAAEKLIENEKLPFTAKIDGFDAFGDRTIFAKVNVDSEQKEMWNTLKTAIYRQLNEDFPNQIKKDNREFQPHLTVANRDIPAGISSTVLEYFKEIELPPEFIVDNIAIFTKNKGRWECDESNLILFENQ